MNGYSVASKCFIVGENGSGISDAQSIGKIGGFGAWKITLYLRVGPADTLFHGMQAEGEGLEYFWILVLRS